MLPLRPNGSSQCDVTECQVEETHAESALEAMRDSLKHTWASIPPPSNPQGTMSFQELQQIFHYLLQPLCSLGSITLPAAMARGQSEGLGLLLCPQPQSTWLEDRKGLLPKKKTWI